MKEISEIVTIEKITFYDDRSFYIRDGRRSWYKKKDAFSLDYEEILIDEEIRKLESAYYKYINDIL